MAIPKSGMKKECRMSLLQKGGGNIYVCFVPIENAVQRTCIPDPEPGDSKIRDLIHGA